MIKPKEVVAIVLYLALFVFLFWFFGSAASYNVSRDELCKEHGLVVVHEYPFGNYGCGKVIPYEDF